MAALPRRPRLEAVVSRKSRALWCVFAIAGLIAFYLWASIGLSGRANVLRYTSGIYDMDVARVVDDWTTYLPGGRISVHPLSKIAIAPVGIALRRNLGGETPGLSAARILIASATAVNALLVAWLAFGLSRRPAAALTALALYAASFSSILLGTIPELASLACLSATAPLVYLNARLGKPVSRFETAGWAALAVLGIAITITQIAAAYIALAVRVYSLRRDAPRQALRLAIVAPLLAAAGIGAGVALQSAIYPGAKPFYREDILSDESPWMRVDDIRQMPLRHTARLLRQFAVYDFVAPFPAYSDYLIEFYDWDERDSYWSLSLEEKSLDDWQGLQWIPIAALAIWLGLAATGLRHADLRYAAPAAFVAFQLALHFVYGREYVLYSGNWHGVLVALLAAATWRAGRRYRSAVALLVVGLSVSMLANNLAVLKRTYAEVEIGLGMPVRTATGAPLPARPDRAPNVLLLTVDTLRPDYMSMNGYDRATTPKLDALISGGFYFDRALSPIGRTTPALASLLTGAYPHRTGVRGLTDSLADGVETLAERLERAGYQTTAVVSNQVLASRRRLDAGFAHYDMAKDDRDASATTQAALEQLAVLRRDRPAFVWVHYIDPHVPYDSTPNLVRMMDPTYVGRYARSFGHRRRPGEPVDAHRTFPADLPKGIATHRNPLPDAVNAHIRRLYAADIRFLDLQIGRLLAGIRAFGSDDWLIVFTADHGENLGEHALFFDHGDYVDNASTRVPLAFVLPRGHPLHGAGHCPGWVSLVDVAPTLLELLRLDPSTELREQFEGRSLAPCFRGEPLDERPVFAESGFSYYPDLLYPPRENSVAGRTRAVIHDGFKLVWSPGSPPEHAWELYRLDDDPHETHDLYRPDHPALPALRAQLQRWMQRATDPGPSLPLDDADRRALRALGYIE